MKFSPAKQSLGGRFWRGLSALAVAAGGAMAMVPTSTLSTAHAYAFADEEDVIILKAGNVEIRGEILAETDTTIKFKGKMSGITIEKEFAKSDLASITRGKKAEAKPDSAPTPGAKPSQPATAPKTDSSTPDVSKTNIYVIEMVGEFGVDISQTPIRAAVRDALKNKADVIICVLDSKPAEDTGTPASVEERFDEIFRSEAVTPIFVEEIPRDWKPKPRIVFWVKNAIGGSAMLPFVCPEVYMSSEAVWGGIGYLTNQFDGVGNAVVQHKQYSLRIGHAQGWANTGGYNPNLINAMAAAPYVMSYKITGDKVEFFERMPDPLKGEILLTDDGEGANRDSIKAILENKGDDCLTLMPKVARDIKVSKGTVDKMDDLIFSLGYERTGNIIAGRSKAIMDGWKKEVVDAKKSIRRAIDDYRDVRVEEPGDYAARTKARGIRKNRIERILSILEKYEEAITQRWRGQNGVPPNAALRQIIDNIKTEQMLDRPEGR
jgi:hypothetical protein